MKSGLLQPMGPIVGLPPEVADSIRREKYGDIEATYSAQDNKLRLRCFTGKLPPEVYERVKAAGFSWAPKQGLFVAPAWTPEREDLALELAGEVGDEGTTLEERAEQRAERFDGYRESRKADAEGARQVVSAIADNIPLGQPILVGHHSERRARRDAERIRSGMERVVKNWKTAEYWKERAAGARGNAAYKELPGVRARRIKGLEADGRKWEKTTGDVARALAFWKSDGLTMARAVVYTNYLGGGMYRCYTLAEFPRQPSASQYEGEMSLHSALTGGVITAEQARDFAVPRLERHAATCARWVEHITNRLTYERAMLEEGGGLAGAKFDYQPGGRVLRRGKWYPVVKVNKRGGQLVSVTVAGHWCTTISIEEITDYRTPGEGDAEKAKAIATKPPLCNYPGEGFRHMTKADWDGRSKWSDAPTTATLQQTEKHGRHRVRSLSLPAFKSVNVFLTDAKRTDPPAPSAAPAPRLAVERETTDAEEIRAETERLQRANAAHKAAQAEAAPFRAVEESLKAGVSVVVAPQLFPTPAPLAALMVEAARLEPGMRVLEPSAGTGAILRAIVDAELAHNRCGQPAKVTAIEINMALVRALPLHLAEVVRCADFLSEPAEGASEADKFDRIIMNPPFERGADIEHIRHALKFLRAGGRLVALCADGPRQREALQAIVAERGGSYRPLPEGSFRSQGTEVRVAMVVIEGAAS